MADTTKARYGVALRSPDYVSATPIYGYLPSPQPSPPGTGEQMEKFSMLCFFWPYRSIL